MSPSYKKLDVSKPNCKIWFNFFHIFQICKSLCQKQHSFPKNVKFYIKNLINITVCFNQTQIKVCDEWGIVHFIAHETVTEIVNYKSFWFEMEVEFCILQHIKMELIFKIQSVQIILIWNQSWLLHFTALKKYHVFFKIIVVVVFQTTPGWINAQFTIPLRIPTQFGSRNQPSRVSQLMTSQIIWVSCYSRSWLRRLQAAFQK